MLEVEYGSTGKIGFAKVTMHDAKGKEIKPPKCPKCRAYKSQIIGKNAYKWVCTSCE